MIFLTALDHIILLHMSRRVFLLLLLLPLCRNWCYDTFFSANEASDVATMDTHPTYDLLVSASKSKKSVYLYQTPNYNLLKIFTFGSTPNRVRFTRDGLYIAIAVGNSVQFYSITFPYALGPSNTFGGSTIRDMDLSFDNTRILICYSSSYRVFSLYSFSSTSITVSGLSDNTIVCKLGRNLDVGLVDDNRRVIIYDSSNNLKTTFRDSQDYADLDFRPNTATPARVIAASTNKYGQHFYWGSNAANTNLPTPLSNDDLNAACYSKDTNYFSYGGKESKVFILNGTNDDNSILNLFRQPQSTILSCVFSWDLKYLYVGGSSGDIYVYSNNCLSCPIGTYSTASACTPCSTAIANCATCDDATTCTYCVQGFFLNSTYKCQGCEVMEGCSVCANSSKCLECVTGYYLLGNNCQLCKVVSAGCYSCSKDGTLCYTCFSNFYLSAGNLCIRCSATGCVRCSTNTQCIQCTIGYYLLAGVCTICNANCTSCQSTPTNCSSCLRGLYLSAGVCTPCTFNCLICNTTTNCIDCYVGYYALAGTCTPCPTLCVSCLSTAICTTCTIGTYLSTNVCLPCPSLCTACLSPTNCIGCAAGYYLTASNLCVDCAGVDVQCTTCNRTQCYSCNTGYYLLGGVCTVCTTNCVQCTTATYCLTCTQGFSLSGTNTCLRCTNNCQSCTATTCLSCLSGYYLSAGTCTTCTLANCTLCNTSTTCFSCTIGFYLLNALCVNCDTAIPYCSDCLTATHCLACAQSTYLTSANACAVCGGGCTTCTLTYCMTCATNYYLNLGTCSNCPAKCNDCNATACITCNIGYTGTNCSTPCNNLVPFCQSCSAALCLWCVKGFYLSAGGCVGCATALTHCLDCTDASTCLMCSYGYYLGGGVCTQCGIGCASCTTVACAVCYEGYFLSGGVCTPCAQKCALCTATACLTCSPTYTFSSGDCTLCSTIIPACDICSSTPSCLRCDRAYYLSAGGCLSCQTAISNCYTCNSSTVCTSCAMGFYVNANVCVGCVLGCTLCTTAALCSKCSPSYYLSSTTCVLCSAVMPGCVYCASATVCSACQNGYYLSAANCTLCGSMQGCVSCSSATLCTDCSSGFYLSGGTCMLCMQGGCAVCSESQPTICVTCATGYYLSNASCTQCHTQGCLNCNSSTCMVCEGGYYLSANNCLLCSNQVAGCLQCSANALCTQCQALYYLDGSSCRVCAETMSGCSNCINATECISCDANFYLANSTCRPCTAINNCLLCASVTQCMYCAPQYYLLNNMCSACSIITNCYECSSGSVCSVCQSGYAVKNNKCEAITITGGSATALSQSTPYVKFITEYVNSSALKHTLRVQGMKYNPVQVNWQAGTKIYLETKTRSILLTISSVEYSPDLSDLIFYTDNPATFTPTTINFTRLLLSSLPTNYQTSLSMTHSVLNQILPTLQNEGDLTTSYNLNESQFYKSYLFHFNESYYFLIGMIISSLLFILYFIRATCSSPSALDHATLVPHIFALKTVSLILFPTFNQYINYCYGFMSSDLPFLTPFLSLYLSNASDTTPQPYLLYYTNLNFASTFLPATVLCLLLLLFGYLALRNSPTKLNSYSSFLINYFLLGLVFSSCGAVQGSIANLVTSPTVNAVMYILGIGVYLGVMAAIAVGVYRDAKTGIGQVRVLVKGTLLSFAHISPIPVVSVGVVVDILLLVVEVHVKELSKVKVLAHGLVISAFVVLFYAPQSILVLYITTGLVVVSILIQGYLMWVDAKLEQQTEANKQEQEYQITKIQDEVFKFQHCQNGQGRRNRRFKNNNQFKIDQIDSIPQIQ